MDYTTCIIVLKQAYSWDVRIGFIQWQWKNVLQCKRVWYLVCLSTCNLASQHNLLHPATAIGMFAVISRLGLVGREPSAVTALWPGNSVVFTRVDDLPEFVFSLLIKISEIFLDTLKEGIPGISLPDHITWMKINWQIQKKWKGKLKITSKMCIMLQRLPQVLPFTSSTITRVLCCGLTSHFGDSKIPIQ